MSQTAALSRRNQAKASTRRAIIDAALERFGTMGYAGSLISAIALDAGVTTGAIYHHFGGKKELFFAAASALEGEVLEAAAAAAVGVSTDEPWLALERSMLASLEMTARPSVARILFQEAPSIIGPTEWRLVQQHYALGALTTFLQHLAQTAELRAPSISMLAQMLIGALIEGANAVVSSENHEHALIEAKETVQFVLRGIRFAKVVPASSDA